MFDLNEPADDLAAAAAAAAKESDAAAAAEEEEEPSAARIQEPSPSESATAPECGGGTAAAWGRSASLSLLIDPESPKKSNVVENGEADKGKTSLRDCENILCEFVPLKTTETEMTSATEVSNNDQLVCSTEIDLIDAFAQQREAGDDKSEVEQPGAVSEDGDDRVKSGCMHEPSDGSPVEDARFPSVFWKGRVNFQDAAVDGMVAACTSRWYQLFSDRKLPGELSVQRFTGTDKFVCAIKEYMAEPAVRVMQRPGTSSQNLNKLVQVLVGGAGIDSDLSLNAPSSKGPLVALIPLYDEGKVWLADMHLLPASLLSDVEPGELSAPDEDLLYGFLSVSSSTTPDDSFSWLKEGSSVTDVEKAVKSDITEQKSKKLRSTSNGDVSSDKRAPDLSGDNRQQDLEEGQLEDQSVKEVAPYDRRKRYGEDEKKMKANGDTESAKTRDRHRPRDHERDRETERERGRRERDREVDHRDRDREGVYARRGNHDYLPRLDTKGTRHRDGDKERSLHSRESAITWENGGTRGPGTKERVRELERSKSREREKERPAEKNLKEPRSSKAGMKAPDSSKAKPPEGLEKKRRERSPMDSHRGNAKRLKDGPDDPKVIQLAEKLAALTENKALLDSNKAPKGKQTRHDSEEPSLSSGDSTVVVDEADHEVYIEMLLETCDDDTRGWLTAKQNAVFLREDYGITLLRKENSSADLTKAEQEPLHLKLMAPINEICDASEGKYFVTRAAKVLKEVARRGVFSKSLWYPGPVQPYASAAPPVHMVVRKLKGDDGKNLDNIQEATGVMVGLVLDADNKKGGSSRVVGVRLRSARKKGLTEATRKARELLREVALHFAKEMNIAADVNGLSDEGNAKSPRLLYVSQLPEYASARMLRAIFENVLREKLKKDTELPPGFEQSADMVSDVKYSSDEGCAFVEFASDDLLEGALQLYTNDRDVFCGLKAELPSPPEMRIYEQLVGESDPKASRIAKALKDSGESECDYLQDEQSRSGNELMQRKVKPLFLTELPFNANSESIMRLFEGVIANHINPLLDAKLLVLAARHIPSRGCMFVDLASSELVEFMLDLYNRKPDVFEGMKMELGRIHVSYEGSDRKRNFEKTRSERNLSPRPPKRRAENDEDFDDGFGRRKQQRSDPEKTVYADRLPENSSDAVIRKIFRSVLLEHMSPQQRSQLGDEVVTEVRHVKMKYCAFVVFASEELARLALELYSRDEEIFDNMRLKPHFNSRLEDIYKEEGHERDDDTISVEHRSEQEFQESARSVRGGGSSRGFKEVDRKRSVYVDRIPEMYHEVEIKEALDRFLRRKGRGSPTYVVNHVSFFRDKYDPSKLCAFVEVKNEDAVQDLLDCYAADEGAFDGMRIRPAVKYN